MNEANAAPKVFPRLLTTWARFALFLSLFAPDPLGGALAQYIPPPASQTYAPAARVTTAPAETPRATRQAQRRSQSARLRQRDARAAAIKKKSRPVAAAASEAKDATPTRDKSNKLIILAGQAQTTIARGAEELAALMNAGGLEADAKIGPISLAQLNDGAAGDVAILQSDALEDARRESGPALTRKLTFIARLFNQEVHILVRAGVKNFADLEGRTIASAAPDTPEGRSAAKLFKYAGLHPQLLEMDPTTALARLESGDVDAAIFVGGKPVPALAGRTIAGLKLVAIPYKGAMQDFYYPAQITKADYPDLVGAGDGVDTVAIGTVLVTFDAKPGSQAYKKLTQFTHIFFERFGALRDGAHHPKWREVNLAADLPGWRRFQPAQKWLDQKQQDSSPPPRLSNVK